MTDLKKIYVFEIRQHGELGNTYQILAEDGAPLGSHITDEISLRFDIQLHCDDFKDHYPKGYELVFVSLDETRKMVREASPGLYEAIKSNIEKFGKEGKTNFDHPRNARIKIKFSDGTESVIE